MLTILLLALCSRGDIVGGLRPGETALVLGADDVVEKEQPFTYLRPRVLDAATGLPLANVCLEAWTENGQKGVGLELCVDRTLTQRDGTARLRARLGAAAAEKVRLSCPGHASRTISVSDSFGDVLLFDAMPLEGRILDLADHPVANAIVRTRETCSHAIPASQTRTDAFGRFRLEDCPVEEGGPELEVQGDGTEPLFQLDVGHLRTLGALYGELVLHVARRAPIELRVIDAEGAPMAWRRVSQRNLPTAESWTDAEGLCTLPPPAEGRDQTLYLNDVGDGIALTAGQFPAGSVSTVCPWDSFDERALNGRVQVEFKGAEASDETLDAWVFDARGNIGCAGREGPAHVVPGSARVIFGAPFSGWRTIARDITVGNEPVVVEITPQREPTLHVRMPPDSAGAFVSIQAGSDSVSRARDRGEYTDFDQAVPSGVPFVVWIESPSGEQRRLVHPPISSDTDVELSAPATLVRKAIAPEALPLGHVRCTVVDSAGHAIPDLTGELIVGDVSTYDLSFDGPGPFSWAVPAKLPYRLSFSAKGYERPLSFEGVVPVEDAPVVVHEFVLRRSAHVELRGAIEAIEVGGPEPDAVEGGFDLETTPGPLTLRIGRTGLPPIALDLVLADGETRRIDVR